MNRKITRRRPTIIETINGKSYIFSYISFKEYFNNCFIDRKENYSGEGNYTRDKLKQEIADKANVGFEAVRNWYSGQNGPSDLKIVKDIAECLGIDYKKLLVLNVEEIGIMNRNSKIESFNALSDKEVIIEIYKKIMELINLHVYKEMGYEIPSHIDSKNPDSLRWLRKHLILEMRHIVDYNALEISNDTRNKLHNIISEVDFSVKYADVPARWQRINECVLDAQLIFELDVLSEEDMEEAYEEFYDHFNVGVESKYTVEYGNIGISGFCTKPSQEEAIKRIKYHFDRYNDKNGEEFDPNKVYISENKFMDEYEIDDRALHRNELVRTILAIFKEDFSEYFCF